MSARRRRMTASEVISILGSHGFELVSQKGSHQKWRNPETRRQVIVPMHKGKDLPIGTLISIQRGSGIPDDVWKS